MGWRYRMGLALTIVGGLVVISVIAVIGDIVSKSLQARNSVEPAALKALTDRIEALEKQADERDSRLARLEGDIAFTTKLLEEKHG
jgi:uncharacterized coiled-coil protein SlyX